MDKITRTTPDEREAGKSLEADARGVLARLAQSPDATVYDLGTDNLKLREDDNRDAMISAVRGEAAKMARFAVAVVRVAKVYKERDEVREESIKKQVDHYSEILESCLKGLENDFKRGIVAIDENSDAGAYETALEADRSAGTTWEIAQERLFANDSALLKKAATMQGKGELIGVFQNGELCIIDRSDMNGNREPVITAFDAENNRITITNDTPDRADVMQSIAENDGRFANYWGILQAVSEDGFTVPQDSPEYEKKGIVAAVEAVSGKPFVKSKNGNEWRSAILDCGDVSNSALVRAVYFDRAYGIAVVYNVNPSSRRDDRGAVRVLRG